MAGDEKSKLKALSDIASIDITLEFGSILQNILKLTCETMNAHSGTMMLIEENNELRMVASYGLSPDYPERVHESAKKAGVPLTFSPSGAVLETGKCYIVQDVFKEPRCRPWYNLSKEFGFSSQIFTPIKTGLKVIGLLNVYMANPHQFTEEEINFVTIAASQASSVGQNARMCSKLNDNLMELKDYKELKEADRLKSEFVSNITHELFTPITSIKGFTELIHSGDLGEINEEQKNGLETILRSSDRLSRLLKQLLDVANIEKDQLDLRLDFTSINDVILKSIMELQSHVKDKQITIFQEIPTLPRIWGDSERLTQVMINVLSNAIKFTPENGKITITADENTDSVKISITDTGIGIPQDKLLRIFDRFYQVDGSTSRKHGGVGIGLSICKGIIEKHRGSIWAESDGNGSTFHIVLPKLMQKTGELDD